MKLHPLIALAFTSSVLHAGPPAKTVTEIEPAPKVEWQVRAAEAYTFDGDFKDSRYGSQSALQSHFAIDSAIPLGGRWYGVLGGGYERFDFSTSDAPVPDSLQALYGIAGLEYRIEGKPALFLRFRPGLYAGGDLEDGAFDMPGVAALAFRPMSGLILSVGARFSLLSEWPVLPVGGFIWTPCEWVEINGMLPQASILFKAADGVQFGPVFQITGDTYRTDDGQVFAGEDVDYLDMRAGLGVQLTRWEPLDISLVAGWSIRRLFSYDDLDREYRVEGAPFVGLSIKASF